MRHRTITIKYLDGRLKKRRYRGHEGKFDALRKFLAREPRFWKWIKCTG